MPAPVPSPPSPPPPPTPHPPEHEFNEKQNALIRDLANAMTWVCIPLLAIGIMYFIGAFQVLYEAFTRPGTRMWGVVLYIALAGLFPLVMGIWTKRAAESFEKITKTTGRDMTHLMGALQNLRNLYGLLRAFIIAYALLVVAALIVGLVTYYTSGAPK